MILHYSFAILNTNDNALSLLFFANAPMFDLYIYIYCVLYFFQFFQPQPIITPSIPPKVITTQPPKNSNEVVSQLLLLTHQVRQVLLLVLQYLVGLQT